MMNASSMAGPQEILWPQFTGRGARSYRVCRIGIVSEIEATEERVTQHADCTWSRQKEPSDRSDSRAARRNWAQLSRDRVARLRNVVPNCAVWPAFINGELRSIN